MFCINFYHALQIISLNKKIEDETTVEDIEQLKTEKQSKLVSLLTTETLEVFVPLAYALCYATAYFGPNAYLMGGVKNDYWQNANRVVTDVNPLFSVMFQMFAIDTCGGIVVGILLGLTCNINFFAPILYVGFYRRPFCYFPISIARNGSVFTEPN